MPATGHRTQAAVSEVEFGQSDAVERSGTWRRVVAGGMALLFALTLIMLGAVCAVKAAPSMTPHHSLART